MNNNFDELVERRNTASLKWEANINELPMWVADMDFPTAPAIIEAIQRRAQSGIFGYSIVPESWNDAIVQWWKKRHGFEITPESLVFCTGVIPAISSMIRKFTTVGENVMVQTPVYDMFFNSITNNGRHMVENKLKYDGKDYQIDFDDLEKRLADPQTTLMLLCNPHNPIGKIWDRETLSKIGELCFKHQVLVISDEIHCDLTDPGCDYVPFAAVSEHCAQNSITCLSPSKSFNLAGLQTAAIMVPNEMLQHKARRALNTDEVAEPNAFAVDATIAAYTKGEEWLDGLRHYVYENKQRVKKFLENELPQVKLINSGATYLLWLDCNRVSSNSIEMAAYLRSHTGLWLSAGSQYGGNGKRFLRMNIGCPRSRLEDGLQRLKEGITAYESWSISQC